MLNNYSSKYSEVEPRIPIVQVFDKNIACCLNKIGYSKISLMQYRVFDLVNKEYSVIVIAPTGTGKTEAALFPVIKNIYSRKLKPISAIYITPLRALNRDIFERLLKIVSCFNLKAEIRHGDTPQSLRLKIKKDPPDILITTPESFQYIIIDAILRDKLRNLKYIIIDEFRELVVSKRGIELISAISNLENMFKHRIIKIALTATLQNIKEAVSLLDRSYLVKVVETGINRNMNIEIISPGKGSEVEVCKEKNCSDLGIEEGFLNRIEAIVEKIKKYKHVLVFVNTRDLVEKLSYTLSLLYKDVLVDVHHGSLSRMQRLTSEKKFKQGLVNALIATSSLELGLDIGTVKYVIQYMSPRQATRLIQRIGRSLHRFNLNPRGAIITLDNFYDIIESIVIARRAVENLIEKEDIPSRPLDVLAHQISGFVLINPGVSIDTLYSFFTSNRVFRYIGYDEFMDVVRYLVHARILKVKDDKLYPTSRSKIYYYKITMIPDVRNVDVIDVTCSSGSCKIGSLSEDFVTIYCEKDSIIVLGGKIWRVISYDNVSGKVYVEPVHLNDKTESIIIPRWEGENIPVDYTIAREAGALLRLMVECIKGSRLEHCKVIDIPIFKQKSTLYRRSLFINTNVENKVIQVITDLLREMKIVPSDRDVVVEVYPKYHLIVFYLFLGSKGNNLLKEVLKSIFRQIYSSPNINAYSSPYYIIFEIPRKPKINDVYTALKLLHEIIGNDSHLETIIKNSNYYLLRIFFVAQRFGAIDPKKVKITRNILRSFVDTVIGLEAYKETILRDFNINVVKKFINNVKSGKIRVHVVELNKPSLLLKEALQRIPHATYSLDTLDLSSFKVKLLNKNVTLLCLMCGDTMKGKVVDFIGKKQIACSVCGSRAIAVLKSDGSIESNVVKKVLAKKKLSNKEREIFRDLQRRAKLFMDYGIDALIALAGHGVGAMEASRILYQYKTENEDLFKLIYEAEKKFLIAKKFIVKKGK